MVDREVLPDKTIVSYWWKRPDRLLKHQISNMVSPPDLQGLTHVDVCTGGDHGVGRFRMLLKVLFRYTGRPSITRRFEIANVSHSSDDIGILNKTVLQNVINGLRDMHNGGRFIARLDDNNNIELSFDALEEGNILCNVPIRLFINGDLKYCAQMLGRDGMSSNWCMWCRYHLNDWNGLISVPVSELWSIGQQHQFFKWINSGELKEPKDKKGIIDSPLTDFIQPDNYIFPQLHFEIGTVNNVLDGLRQRKRWKSCLNLKRRQGISKS